jgi:hypothetical protein
MMDSAAHVMRSANARRDHRRHEHGR